MRTLALTVMFFALYGCGSEGPGNTRGTEQPLRPLPIPIELPPYEHIQAPGQLVVVLATNMHDTLYGGLLKGVPADLIGAGFSLLSMDLPCHGADQDVENPLVCWQTRIEAGDADIFRRFCGDLSAVLNDLGATDVSIVGQSRGGYVATVCAAYDTRIRNLALIMPVTDLQRLTEFDGYSVDQTVFGLAQYDRFLADRSILVRIGADDTRVGTDAVASFATSVGAELVLVGEAGHDIHNNGEVAAWLVAHQ